MIQTPVRTFQELIYSPNPNARRLAIGGVLGLGSLLIALIVGIFGPLVALALAAALIAGSLALQDTRWGFVAVLGVSFALPFATLPFSIGFKPTFLDVALGGLVFVWLLKLITGRQRRFLSSPLGLLVALFMLLALFSFVFGMTHSRATSFTLRRFAEILLGIGLFFVVLNTVRTQRELEWVTRWVLLSAGLCAAVAVVLYIVPESAAVWFLNGLARFDYPGGYGALRYIEDDPSGIMRAIGTAVDPNVLGGMMILGGGILGTQVVAPRTLLPRWLVASLFLLALAALYLTYSRSALFGLAAAFALPGVLKYRKLIPLGIVGALLLFLLPQTQDYVARLLAGLAGEDLATQMRFGEFKDALILIRRYPLFGVGFTGVPDIDIYVGVSMLYLIIAENMGLIGLGTFLLVQLGFFTILLRGWRSGIAPEREAILLGLAGAVFGALVSGLADHYWFNMTYPHMTVLFWLFLGLATATLLIEREETRQKEWGENGDETLRPHPGEL